MGEDFRKPKEFRPLAEVYFEWLEDYVLGSNHSVSDLALPPAAMLAWMARGNPRKTLGGFLAIGR
jgi:hypothetical protein